ncbi:MAG TPA: FAD-dependent oxidoreductase [Thermoleophilaceae bacterium]
MTALPTACVVGAGVSGVATARSLSRRGVPFECFDGNDRVGGLRASREDLRGDVAREELEFADWPMPRSYPRYPDASLTARYLRDYAAHFGLDRHFRLGTRVESARRTDRGRWEVELDTGERRSYEALVVATGRSSAPSWPDARPGEFAGEQIHSDAYRDRETLRDRDVLVVGLGASACDVAVASSYVARSTHLAVHSGVRVLPQTAPGRAGDWLAGGGSWRLAGRSRRLAAAALHRIAFGPMEAYGLPAPRGVGGATHPVRAPHLLERLQHGRIAVAPAIERLEGDRVRFADGTRVKVDLIVWCTGYEIRVPFLDPDLVPVQAGGRVELHWSVFSPNVPSLAFVGLLEPGPRSATRIVEGQGACVAACLGGDYALPSEREASNGARRGDYARGLRREMRRGRRRARVANEISFVSRSLRR